MSVSLLSCPHCRSTFKMHKILPIGIDIPCPKCKERFTVAKELIRAGKEPAKAMAPASAPDVSRDASTPELESPPTTGGFSGRSVALIVGAIAVLALGLGAVFMWPKTEDNKPTPQITKIAPTEGPSGTEPSPPIGPSTNGNGNSSPPPQSEDPKQQIGKTSTGLQLTRAEKDQIDLWIKKGVEYLKRTQRPNGTWALGEETSGEHPDAMAAMGGLTLLSCGEPADSPYVAKAAKRVRESFQDMRNTYGISFYILFLAKLDAALGKLTPPQRNKLDEQIIRSLSARLIAGQLPDGSWDYPNPNLTPQQEKELYDFLLELGTKSWQDFSAAHPDRVRDLNKQSFATVLNNLSFVKVTKDPLFEKAKNDVKPEFYKKMLGQGNNSTTQLALLALHSAKQAYDVPAHQPLLLTVKRFRATQTHEGTWPYDAIHPRSAYPGPAMTCCGLIVLTVGYSLADVPRPHDTVNDDPNVQRAFAAVARDIDQDKAHPGSFKKGTSYGGYAFWSLERVGVLFSKSKIGDHDWFRYGLKSFPLFEIRNKKGEWEGGWKATDQFHSPATDTCFFLLFLQQVNLIEWEKTRPQNNPFIKPDLAGGGNGPLNPLKIEKK